MKHCLFIILLVLSITTAQAKTITLGIDVSGSNPLLTHENFAYMAGQYVSKEISALKNGDIVRIQTLGGRGNTANLLSSEYVISRKLKPKKITAMVTRYIQSLPQQRDVSQGSTNLLAWLEFTHGFACQDNSLILLLTDGLESSEAVNASAFLSGKQGLPKPDVDLSGCALTFYGLGVGRPAPQVKRVRKAWRDWAKQSGATFTAVIP